MQRCARVRVRAAFWVGELGRPGLHCPAQSRGMACSRRGAEGTSTAAGFSFPALPADCGRLPTDFETRLYKVCAAIPEGKVSTYGAMAKALKSSPRAVGQALKRNPYAPTVPCHRVITSDLQLGGFSGTWGTTPETIKKRALLEAEGVNFEGAVLANPGQAMSVEALRHAASLPA